MDHAKLDILYQLYGTTEYFKVLFPGYKPKNNSKKPIQKQQKVLKLYNSNFNNVGKFTDNVVLEPDYYNQDIDLSRIKFNKSNSKAARGSYATVYLRYLNSNNQIKSNIVFKKINDIKGDEYQASIFHYLLYFYYQLYYPNLTDYLCDLKELGKVIGQDSRPVPNLIYGIMDNCGKELYEIKKSKLLLKINLKYRYNFVINIFMKCLYSLQLIHNVGYLHCDIKLENYLINFNEETPLNPVIKIIDFGFVRKNKYSQFDLIGTSFYIPNDFVNNRFNEKNTTLEYHHDFFSLGCMFIEILFCLLESNNKVFNLTMCCPFITNQRLNNQKIKKCRANYDLETHNKNMSDLLFLLNKYYPRLSIPNLSLIQIIYKMVHPIPSERYIQLKNTILPIEYILRDFNNKVYSS